MLRRERNLSVTVRKPTPVKKVTPLQRKPIKKVTKPVKGIHRVKRAAKPIVRPFKVAPVIKPPSAIKKIAKIVPIKRFTPIAMPKKTISTTPPKEVRRKAVITPRTPQITPIAIEKERREVVKAFEPKKMLIKREAKNLISKIRLLPPGIKFLKINMKVPLGKIAPTPRARPVTKTIGRIIPKVLKKVTITTPRVSPPPKKLVAVPVFRKKPVDIPKAIDLPEKAPVITPATKNFLSALLPGLALFFLKK